MDKSGKSANVAILRLGTRLTHFLAWWQGELFAMVPARLRHWWSESDRVLLLSFDEMQHAVFESQTSGKREVVLSLDMTDPDIGTKGLRVTRDLFRRLDSNSRVSLCLPKEEVLRRLVSLPLVTEENLRQTLCFELDRYTPFKADQVYFDYRILARDPVFRKLDVEIWLARKATVDDAVARTAILGLNIERVLPTHDSAITTAGINLLPGSAIASNSGKLSWSRVAYTGFALLLLAALLAIPVWQKRAAAISLLSPLAEAKAAAIETDKLRERLDRLVAEHNLLPDKKWQSTSALLVLDELSRLLPDDSYVTMLDYDGKTVQIQGESTSAAGLVEKLDASPMFKEVGFKAQVAKVQGTSNDRFHISASLDVGARPPITPVKNTPAAVSPTSAEALP